VRSLPPLMYQLLAVLCAACVLAQPAVSATAEEKRLIAFVTRAAALVETRGSAKAFEEFRKPGSEWFHDDTYLFAYDMELNVLLNPAYPEREGRNLAGQHDARGKDVHDEIRAVVRAHGSGWVDAVMARPGSTTPTSKRVYVMGVMLDGKPGIIGSGFYPR